MKIIWGDKNKDKGFSDRWIKLSVSVSPSYSFLSDDVTIFSFWRIRDSSYGFLGLARQLLWFVRCRVSSKLVPSIHLGQKKMQNHSEGKYLFENVESFWGKMSFWKCRIILRENIFLKKANHSEGKYFFENAQSFWGKISLTFCHSGKLPKGLTELIKVTKPA